MYICCFSAQNSWKLFAKDSNACAVLHFQSPLADMIPLVNTGVEGMTYLSSKRLMVGGGVRAAPQLFFGVWSSAGWVGA